MRTSIWKGLKARAKAIRTALNKYNRLAALMKPPAPVLQWKDVVNYTFISKFDLLRNTYAHHTEVVSAVWTVPRNREVATKHFKILCARAELPRLDRELQRLDTSIELERREYARAVNETLSADPLLAAELREQYQSRRRVHNVHLARIAAVRALPGYTGSFERGIPLSRGRELFEGDEETIVQTARNVLGTEGDGGGAKRPALLETLDTDEGFQDETRNTDMVRFVKFLERTE